MGSVKCVAIMLLSLIGLANIIKMTILSICRNSDKRSVLIVPINKNDQNAEEIIRNKAMNMNWSDKKQYVKIYCIGNNLDEETREICIRICGEYSNVEYMDLNNFEKNKIFDE